MGKRGPVPKPTALRVVEGDPSHHKKRSPGRIEPTGKADRLVTPPWLGRYAKARFQQLAPQLRDLGITLRLDRDILAAYCDALARFKVIKTELDRVGYTYTTDSGMRRVVPEYAILERERAAFVRFGAELGIGPASRTRLTVDEEGEEDEFEARFL